MDWEEELKKRDAQLEEELKSLRAQIIEDIDISRQHWESYVAENDRLRAVALQLREALDVSFEGNHRFSDCLLDCDINAERECIACIVNGKINAALEASAFLVDGEKK